MALVDWYILSMVCLAGAASPGPSWILLVNSVVKDGRKAGIAFGIATVVGMWFALQADIAEAKELPIAPPPDVTRMEYDMKDQLIRQTIMTTQEDVQELKQDMKRIEDKIDKLR